MLRLGSARGTVRLVPAKWDGGSAGGGRITPETYLRRNVMLTNQQKASIHIAKNERGMSDQDYRALLTELTGAVSSTDPRLGDKEYQAIMKAINNTADATPAPSHSEGASISHRDVPGGWKDAQVRKFRQYVRLCKMDLTEARQLLYRAVGAMNEESPQLTQLDFDDTMSTIEAELEVRVQTGRVTVPGNIDLRYWRRRRPGKGAANTRENLSDRRTLAGTFRLSFGGKTKSAVSARLYRPYVPFRARQSRQRFKRP